MEMSKFHPIRVDEFIGRQQTWLHRSRFTDAVVVSNDNKEFPVHRFALMAHSTVFEAMFTHNLKEKQLGRCELKDVDGDSVELLLDYVYGCDIRKINQGNAERMLIMADKYEMLDLLAACEAILINDIPVEKAFHYLFLAGQRGLIKLKEAALSVVRPNNIATVLENGRMDICQALQSDPNFLASIVDHCLDKMHLVTRPSSPEDPPL